MKSHLLRRNLSVATLVTFFLILTPDLARAEVTYVKFDHDTRWTFISSALILAVGMIVSAALKRGPK